MMNEMKIAGERIAAVNPKLMLKTIFALNTEIRRIMTNPPRPNRAPRPRLRSGEGQKETGDVERIGIERDSNCRRRGAAESRREQDAEERDGGDIDSQSESGERSSSGGS